MEAIERGTLRLSKGASASLAAIALLFVAMDHDMLLALAPVGPTVLVVAELLLGVHAALLLLTSYTSKDVAEIRFSFNSPFVHGCLGRYLAPRCGEKTDIYSTATKA